MIRSGRDLLTMELFVVDSNKVTNNWSMRQLFMNSALVFVWWLVVGGSVTVHLSKKEPFHEHQDTRPRANRTPFFSVTARVTA